MTAAPQQLVAYGTDGNATGVLTRAVAARVPLTMGVKFHCMNDSHATES